MLKKQIPAVIALFAAVFVCTEISAGLVDHGDMTGFPNVNVDAHFLRIAQKYLPETRQQLPTAPPKWRGDCWDEPIRKKAKGLNIPEEQLKAFVEYVKEPHHMYGLKRVPAPHPELYEFELYADGKRQISTRHYHREIPSAWKKLLELPVEQRRYTTIPVHYSFYIQREDKRQYLEETIAAALEALNSGCYDTQACLLALCRRDVILNEDLPQITAKSPIAERIFLARQDFRAFAVNMKPEKRWRWHNDMDIWVWHNCRGDHAYTGNMPDALYWLKTFENEDSLREIASKDPMLRDVIVAFGLTNLHVPVVRKVAREFARESEINHPVLALRLPYDEAKKLLEGKKEYAALLDLLTIK